MRYALEMLVVLIGLASGVSLGAEPARTVSDSVCNRPLPLLYKEASPAVVAIVARSVRPYRFSNRVQQDEGSGVIFDSGGLVLTNDHVVAGADAVQVTLDNGDTYPARIVGADALFDLAVLQIEAPPREHLPVLRLGDSSRLQIGDDVVAIGNPLGLDQTLTHGIVSGLNRELPDSPLTLSTQMIQTDAAINPGNSGGPLLDRCGAVVGLNAEILDDAQNLGFAIPINLAKAVLPSLLEKGHIVRPWVGFHGQLIDRDTAAILGVSHAPGLLVEAVDQHSPAARAGIRGGTDSFAINGDEYLVGGDLVTEINKVRLDSSAALARIARVLRVGATANIAFYRDGTKHTVAYKLVERPASLDLRIVEERSDTSESDQGADR